MKHKSYALPVFLLSLFLAIVLFISGRFGFLGFLQTGTAQIFFPVTTFLFSVTHQNASVNGTVEALREQNLALTKQLTDENRLKTDNAALRDQFAVTVPSSQSLLPVRVVGMPNTIPNVSFPETLIVDTAFSHSFAGQTVVSKNTVVGVVSSLSSHYAVIQLISNPQSSFPVKTSGTNATGVLKGQGSGEMIMDNVVLSDVLKVGDIVVTLGNQDAHGNGFVPNLIVGKIVSVEKNPSSIFQRARVLPIVPFDHLSLVFLFGK